jgi:hypothetical protein
VISDIIKPNSARGNINAKGFYFLIKVKKKKIESSPWFGLVVDVYSER